MRRFLALTVVLAVVASIVPAAASAQGPIADSGATFTRTQTPFDTTPTADFTGVSPTLSNDHVFEFGWWLRIGSATAETPFPAPASQNYSGNTSVITWNDLGMSGISATETSTVTSTGGPSGRVTTVMNLTNPTAAPITVSLFQMTDFDVQPTAGNDTAALLPDGTIRVSTAGGTNFADYRAPTATAYLVRAFGASDVGAELGNLTVSTFASTGLPFGPGDFTGGYEFRDLVLPAGGSQSVTVTISVNDASPTTTTVTAPTGPSTVGGPARLRAEVSSATAGQVQFFEGGTPLGLPVTVGPDGSATLDHTGFSAGTHPVTAQYSGLANRQGSVSSPVDHVVEATADVSTALACDQEVDAGSTFACVTTVRSDGPGPGQGLVATIPLPAGTTFVSVTAPDWDCTTPAVGSGGDVTCARSTLASGASSTIGLTVGVTPGAEPGPLGLTATVVPASADSDTADRSATDTVAVFRGTSTAVASSANPAVGGQPVTFTATVTDTSAAAPTGTVQFRNGSNDLGAPVPVDANGLATLETAALPEGASSIGAVYSGDPSFRGSVAPALTQQVTAPPGGALPGPTPTPTPVPGGGVGGAGGGGSVDPGIRFAGVQKRVTLSSKGAFGLRFGATGGVPLNVEVTAVVPGTKKKGKRKATKARTVKLYAGRGVAADSRGNIAIRVTLSKTLRAKLPKARKSFAATLTVKAGGRTFTHRFTLVRAKAKAKRKA